MALVLAVEEDCRALALTDDERKELARAAIAAAFAAWPGSEISWITGESEHGDLILPLPQEVSDGE